jgi:putative peptidoglycan lipid II flippase
MGILNSFRRFFAQAFSPVLLKLAMISGALLHSPYFREPIFGLAVGVILGGILQILLQIPFLSRTGISFRGRINFFHPGLKRIAALMVPAMFGLAVYQLNVLIGTLLASFLPRGSISFLYYADRVVEVPLGVFAIALATAVLPTMSEKTALRDIEGLKDTLHYSLRMLLFIILPATLVLAALRIPIINVLFEHGRFGAEETRLTEPALLAYALGLLAFAGVRVVVPTFYSLKDTWTPVRVALATFLLNLALSLILMGPLKHVGLALATSLSAYLNLGLLFYLLRRKIGTFHFSGLAGAGMKMLIASGLMALIIGTAAGQIEWSANTDFAVRVFALAGIVGLGLGVYFFLAFLLRIEEFWTFWNSLIKKKT